LVNIKINKIQDFKTKQNCCEFSYKQQQTFTYALDIILLHAQYITMLLILQAKYIHPVQEKPLPFLRSFIQKPPLISRVIFLITSSKSDYLTLHIHSTIKGSENGNHSCDKILDGVHCLRLKHLRCLRVWNCLHLQVHRDRRAVPDIKFNIT